MKKFTLLLLLLGTLFTSLQGQTPAYRVVGRTLDQTTGEAVGYTTATLRQGEEIAAAVAADAEGRFEVKVGKAGDYRLELFMVGYEVEQLTLEIREATTDLGDIRLKEGVSIDDVVVTVQKPLVISDAEKMSYSVEDDPQASTSTLEEIIRKVPQLSLDAEGNVLLNGESNYKVLVNGRNSATISNNFKEVIKSMPASEILRIEVITNPSTRYEAEGVGGIINLITKRNTQFEGYNGSLSAGGNLWGMPTYYTNGHITLQSGKFAMSLTAYYSDFEMTGDYAQENSTVRENFTGEPYRQESLTRGGYDGSWYGGSLDLSYTIDSLNLITLQGSLFGGGSKTPYGMETSLFNQELSPLSQYTTTGLNRNSNLGGSVALAYEHLFRREGHTLTLSEEFETSPDESEDLARFTSEEFTPYSTLRLNNERGYSNTLQIDYVNPLSANHNLEAGAKHIWRSSNSESQLQHRLPDEERPTAPRFDRIEQQQHILAFYAGYGYTRGRWALRLGARFEQTWNSSKVEESEKEPYDYRTNLSNLIPYASITWRPKDRHSLSLSYTERLQRPSISMLSPAVDDTQPTSRTYGNPDLKAAIFHNINLQYGFFAPKWSLMLGASARLSNNNMTSYNFTEEGILHTTYSDQVHSRFYGLSASVSVRPSQRLNLSLSLNGGYSEYSFAPMAIYTDRYIFTENLNCDIGLWRNARLMLGEFYTTGEPQLGSYHDGFLYYYMGLKQSLFKGKLDLTLMATNPFSNATEWDSVAKTPTYNSYTCSRMKNRQISLRLSWRFGKQNVSVKRTSRSIENDDLQGASSESQSPSAGTPSMGN